MEATRRGKGGGHHRGVSLRLLDTRRAEGARVWDPEGQKALDAVHEGVERRAGVTLTKVIRCEAAHEAVEAETAHSLATEAEALVDVATHDQPPAGDHLAMLVDGEHAGPKGSTGAAREDAEVICVLKVIGEHDAADVEQCGQVRDRKTPHTPGVLEFVGDA